MMNNDLISRVALIAEFEWLKQNTGSYNHPELDEHIERIKKAPAVDAVEVVRCKDCGISEDAPIGEGYLYCNRTCMVVSDNDFCSYGERKMDAEVQDGI